MTDVTGLIVLSRQHVQPLLAARRDGRGTATISLDLGLTTNEVGLTPRGINLPDGQHLSWEDVGTIAQDETGCFQAREGTIRKIHVFSEYLQRPYSLMATVGAPTIINAGFTMHRIVGIDPYQDTLRKIQAVAPVRGRVLDTVTGLGYTAIAAARTAEHVLTVELDPAVLQLARLNPWSQALFDNPKITAIVGDTFDQIQGLDDGSFSCVIHDPPSLSLAGELYSGAYYRQLFRVLRRRGRLFHYVGNLESRQGRRVATGVVRRLHAAGFARVVPSPAAFGLVAYK